MKIKFDIKLSKAQQEIYEMAHDDNIKYMTVAMSRQSGKSTLMKVLCVEWLLENNNNIAYICKNYILAKTIYRSLIKIIPRQFLKSSNASDLIIQTKMGSTLILFSAESGASLRGQTFSHCICDEFAFFNFELTDGTNLYYDVISPTLKVHGKKCIFVSTPLGKNNLFYDMYLRGLDEDYPDYKSILKNIYDDGFTTQDQIEDIRKSIPKLSFEQEYLCKFLSSSQSFFEDYDKNFRKINWVEEKVWIGIDLSGDGKDATILTKINQDSEVRQYKINGTLDMKYQRISDIINDTQGLQMVYIENNGLGAPMFNEIYKLVNAKDKLREWTTTNATKKEIISWLAVKISKNEIWFNEEDVDLKNEFGTFICRVSKNGTMQFEAMNGKRDDRVMSLAIANKCKSDYNERTTKSFCHILRL